MSNRISIPATDALIRTAEFSPCRRYRYALWRRWDDGPYCMFIGLNPSTADETNDDPTIRRCIGFAKSWGYAGLVMTNIFAFRATDPKVMKRAVDPVGPDNDEWLTRLAREAGVVVAAWGTHGSHLDRGETVARSTLLGCTENGVVCLGLTKDGHPKHPLYIKANQSVVAY